MKKAIIVYGVLLVLGMATATQSAEGDSYSAALINRESGLSDKITIFKGKKKEWIARRILGREKVEQKIPESSYRTARARLILFIDRMKPEKIPPDCPEWFEVEKREGGKNDLKIRGCAFQNEEFARLFLNLTEIFH